MAVFTVVVMEAPYGRERAYTALRFALTAALEGHKVRVFLVQDGVLVAKKGQKPDQPEYWENKRFNIPNHPVVGATGRKMAARRGTLLTSSHT